MPEAASVAVSFELGLAADGEVGAGLPFFAPGAEAEGLDALLEDVLGNRRARWLAFLAWC